VRFELPAVRWTESLFARVVVTGVCVPRPANSMTRRALRPLAESGAAESIARYLGSKEKTPLRELNLDGAPRPCHPLLTPSQPLPARISPRSYINRSLMVPRLGVAPACRIGFTGSMKLSSALWSNTALTRLNLNNCKLNDDAGAELGYMIVRNVSLTHLSCAWNLFGIKTAIAFQEGLANTRSACEWCVSRMSRADACA
jgi:hypothetical protein